MLLLLHRVQTANYMVSVSTVISSSNKWPPFNNISICPSNPASFSLAHLFVVSYIFDQFLDDSRPLSPIVDLALQPSSAKCNTARFWIERRSTPNAHQFPSLLTTKPTVYEDHERRILSTSSGGLSRKFSCLLRTLKRVLSLCSTKDGEDSAVTVWEKLASSSSMSSLYGVSKRFRILWTWKSTIKDCAEKKRQQLSKPLIKLFSYFSKPTDRNEKKIHWNILGIGRSRVISTLVQNSPRRHLARLAKRSEITVFYFFEILFLHKLWIATISY